MTVNGRWRDAGDADDRSSLQERPSSRKKGATSLPWSPYETAAAPPRLLRHQLVASRTTEIFATVQSKGWTSVGQKQEMANAAPLASNYFYAPGLFRSRKYWSCHLCSDKILQFRSHCLESCNGGRNPTSPVRPSTQPLPLTQLSPAMPAAAAALPTTAINFSVLLKPRTWNIAKRGCVALPMQKWPI